MRSSLGMRRDVDVEWTAKGTRTYAIVAKGRLELTGWSQPTPGYACRTAEPTFSGLAVRCSCPDGDRQLARSRASGKLYVCKHATVALESVVDDEAVAEMAKKIAKVREEGAQRATKLREEAARRAVKLAAERAAQDKELPGERERVEHGLGKLSAEEIVRHLRTAIETTAGLRNVATIFGPGVMPVRQVLHCLRCDEDYDPQFDTECRIEHPDSRTRWDGSKISWEECYRCEATFNLNGVHSMSRNSVQDAGEYCFQGQHTTDPDVIAEDGFDWGVDISSYY